MRSEPNNSEPNKNVYWKWESAKLICVAVSVLMCYVVFLHKIQFYSGQFYLNVKRIGHAEVHPAIALENSPLANVSQSLVDVGDPVISGDEGTTSSEALPYLSPNYPHVQMGRLLGSLSRETCSVDRVTKTYEITFAKRQQSHNRTSGYEDDKFSTIPREEGKVLQPVWLSSHLQSMGRVWQRFIKILGVRVDEPSNARSNYYKYVEQDNNWGLGLVVAIFGGRGKRMAYLLKGLSRHLTQDANVQQIWSHLSCAFPGVEGGDERVPARLIYMNQKISYIFCPLSHLNASVQSKYRQAAVDIALPLSLAYHTSDFKDGKVGDSYSQWKMDYNVWPRYQCKHRLGACSSPLFGYTVSSADYVPRWVAYHIANGMDHMYVYMRHEELLNLPEMQVFVDAGYATLVYYPSTSGQGGDKMAWDQEMAQQHCIFNHQDTDDWLALMDTDEYFHMSSDTKNNKFGTNFRTLVDYLDSNKEDSKADGSLSPLTLAGIRLANTFYRCPHGKGGLEDFGRRDAPMDGRTKLICRPKRVWSGEIHVITTKKAIKAAKAYDEVAVPAKLIRHNHIRGGKCKGNIRFDMWNKTALDNMYALCKRLDYHMYSNPEGRSELRAKHSLHEWSTFSIGHALVDEKQKAKKK